MGPYPSAHVQVFAVALEREFLIAVRDRVQNTSMLMRQPLHSLRIPVLRSILFTVEQERDNTAKRCKQFVSRGANQSEMKLPVRGVRLFRGMLFLDL